MQLILLSFFYEKFGSGDLYTWCKFLTCSPTLAEVD